MKERPILMSAPMVRVLLDGRKVQTRRTVKGGPVFVTPFIGRDNEPTGEFGMHWTHDRVINEHVRCPYGQPGDKLWVRETWRLNSWGADYPEAEVTYRSDDTSTAFYVRVNDYDVFVDRESRRLETLGAVEREGFLVLPEGVTQPWRPSIFMPRWASRITLEVTDVRVQRLQDISEDDARAEGARYFDDIPDPHPYKQGARWSMESPTSTEQCLGTARLAFANYWERINGDGAWDANPFVWALTFERVTA